MTVTETQMHDKVYVLERFTKDVSAGQVVGRPTNGEFERGGTDREGVISVDHNALRIQPLMKPGWGRAGITYGPFRRSNGLAFGIHVLNGHNTSQTGDLLQTVPRRLMRWAAGSLVQNPALNLFKMLLRGNKPRQLKQLRLWVKTNRQHKNAEVLVLDENFAAGWFSVERPQNPAVEGNAFVVHAAGPENGELWATVGRKPLPIVRGLQNIPLYYVVILRERGAAYYAAALPGAFGVGSYPKMRPLALDPFGDDPELYAAAWQSVLGQIGFWVDTRIYGTTVAQLAQFSQWYGTAQAADRLMGEGELDGTAAETGCRWKVVRGQIFRTLEGAGSDGQESTAVLEMDAPAGLLHVLLKGSELGSAGIVWRWRDEANYWQILAGVDGCRLLCCLNSEFIEFADEPDIRLQEGKTHSLQVADNDATFSVYLDGQLLFDRWFTDERLADMAGAGISFNGFGSQILLSAFEAHPAELSLPETLDFEKPWLPRPDQNPIVVDDFSGDTGDLSNRKTTKDGRTWSHILGNGRFNLSGDGSLKVDATLENPNPGRTAYTIPWNEPNFAAISVCITPPGKGRGEWHRGRGGVIFWQDDQNYIIINTWLDDIYKGASLSSFFYLNGYEDLYDAVWTNVGKRISWGKPYNLRVTFDGINYLVQLNEEPVLYRALTDIYPNCRPLSITRVGLVANWEWGQDTGTQFNNFLVFGQASTDL